MPYRSPEQARLMRAVANSPGFAKKVGIPQSVGKKFEADKAEGGTVKESKKMMAKEVSFMKKKGAPASMIKHEKAEAGMKKGGKAMGYAKGGETGAGRGGMGGPTAKELEDYQKGMGFLRKMRPEEFTGAGRGTMGGPTAKELKVNQDSKDFLRKLRPEDSDTRKSSGFAKGGFTRAADGVASKGKTKGKMVKMAYGGKAC